MTAPQLLRDESLSAPVQGGAGAGARLLRVGSDRDWKLLVGALGLLTLVLGQEWAALPCVVALASVQLPGRTVVRRLALAVMCVFGLNAAVLTVLAIADLSVHVGVLTATYLVLGALTPSPRSHGGHGIQFAGAADWWALGSALTTFAVFYRPFVGASVGERLALLSWSTDAGNHLSYVQSNLDQSGYMSLSQYPQAWAGNMALTIELLIGKDSGVGAFVGVAAPLIVAFYALLVYFAVALVLDLVRAATGHVRPLAAGLAVLCIGLSAILGSGAILLMSASYTQVVAMTVLLVIAGLVVSEPRHDWRYLGVLCLLALVLMQTWYLLAPVLAVMALVALRGVGSQRLRLLLLAPPAAVLAVYPVINGPSVLAHLNVAGGSPFTSRASTWVLLLLTTIAAVGLVRQRGAGPVAPPVLLLLLVTTLLLSTGVAAVQISAGNGFGYYTLKLLLVVFWFGALAVAVVVASSVNRAARRGIRASVPCLALVVLMIGGLAAAAASSRDPIASFAAGRTPPNLDGRVLDAIFTAHPDGLEPGTDAWVVDGCASVADHIANKWTHDLFLTWNTSRRETNNLYRSVRSGDVDVLLARAAEREVRRMEVYVHRECEPAALARLAASPKVTVVRVR